MKTRSRRPSLLVGCVAAGLVVLAVWSYFQYSAGFLAAQTAKDDLASCRQIAGKIELLSNRPARAVLVARSTTELAKQIDDAAQKAKLPSNSVLRIDPQETRRIGDSPYRAMVVSIDLRNVNMEQMIRFLLDVVKEESGLEVTALRLTAPRTRIGVSHSQDERWQVEVTLTYLIFAPKIPDPNS